jgi:hypothetical protein
MSKFQPEFENLEPRQLLAGDFGAAQAAMPLAPGELHCDELYFFAEQSAEDLCFEAELWHDSEGEFAAPDYLAELLLADENAWGVEAQIQTDEELVFGEGLI